jgi:thioredoxin 1
VAGIGVLYQFVPQLVLPGRQVPNFHKSRPTGRKMRCERVNDMTIRNLILGLAIGLIFLGPVTIGCSESGGDNRTGSPTVIASLDGATAFRQALADAGQGLVVVDFYADWCAPCRQLSPLLEEIARKHPDKAVFYKVNVDRNADLMRAFRITGIPHVMFFRNSAAVHSIIGVQRQDAYLSALNRL